MCTSLIAVRNKIKPLKKGLEYVEALSLQLRHWALV